MSKTYNLETILKPWAITKYKNKVVVITFDGDQRFDDLHVNTFDMESDALDFINETFDGTVSTDDYFMFDLRDGNVPQKRTTFKSRDNVIVLGGKFQGKRGVYLCSATDDETKRPISYRHRSISLGNSLVRVIDSELDEFSVEEIPTKDLDLD